MKCLIVLVTVLFTSLGGSQAIAEGDSTPPVFIDLTYEAAAKRAKEENKILLLDAMTSWCAPCKQMDKTTWIDADFVQWLEANTIPIQLDMDEHEALKEKPGINAFPTIIAFNGEQEDRVLGLRDADFMQTWLSAFQKGQTRAQLLLKKFDDVHAGTVNASIEERVELANELTDSNLYEQALEASTWLWENAADQRLRSGPVVASVCYMLGRMMPNYAPARAMANQRFDEMTSKVEKSPSAETLWTWITLAFMTKNTKPVVDWSQRMSNTRKGRALLKKATPRLFGLLVENEAWEAAGHCLGQNLVERLAPYAHLVARNKGTEPPAGKAPMSFPFLNIGTERTQPEQIDFQMRSDGAAYYASLLVVGRAEEASALADYLIQYADNDKAARAALVDFTLQAGVFDQAAERHQKWLNEAWQ